MLKYTRYIKKTRNVNQASKISSTLNPLPSCLPLLEAPTSHDPPVRPYTARGSGLPPIKSLRSVECRSLWRAPKQVFTSYAAKPRPWLSDRALGSGSQTRSGSTWQVARQAKAWSSNVDVALAYLYSHNFWKNVNAIQFVLLEWYSQQCAEFLQLFHKRSKNNQNVFLVICT